MFQFSSHLTSRALKWTLVLVALVLSSFFSGAGSQAVAKDGVRRTLSSADTTISLADYGAIGDGLADDGPALQKALDDLAESAGGTLYIPAGKYRLATPVSKEFAQTAQVTIKGVPSLTPIVVAGNGRGLDLTSEFIIAVGDTTDAITLKGLDSLLIEDVGFVGVIGVLNDARVVLDLSDMNHVTIRHCEFYGLASLVGGGAIISARRTNFTLQQTAFLGCATNSGGNRPLVQISSWLGISVRDCKFVDYGERPDFFSKTPLQSPYAWILVGDAAHLEPAHPRREVVMDNVFLDEGGYFELAIRPDLFSTEDVPYDVYLSRLSVNVNNLFSDGVYIFGARRVFIDRSRLGWSERAGFAITLASVGDVVLDLIDCFVDATRLRASAKRLAVINSTFTSVNSTGPVTQILTTDTLEADPAQYVRQRYVAALNHDPDAAGHFYWTDRILRCDADSSCVGAAHADLDAYLSNSSPAKFSLRGRVVDQSGDPVSGVKVSLTGSDSIAMETTANGEFSFSSLPTAGEYQLTPGKTHFKFDPRTVVTPAGDVVLEIIGTRIAYNISGRVLDSSGNPIAEALVTVSGDTNAVSATDADGNYSFPALTAGGNYMISVSRDNYEFAVSTRSFSNLSADQSSDFTGTPVKYTISGTVKKPDGTALSGAWVSVDNGSVAHGKTTDQDGNYSFTADGDGNYVVTVSFGNLIFNPLIHTFTKLSANVRADFNSAQAFSINVRVTTAEGAMVTGVSLSVTGTELKAFETNSSGNAAFAVAADGTYEITLSKPHYTFNPATIVVRDVDRDQFLESTAILIPSAPVLVSTDDPTRALALDGVLLTSEPFRLSYDHSWSEDRRMRLVLFVTNIDLSTSGSQVDLSVELEDKSGRKYPLIVERAGSVQQIEDMNQIIVRLNDELTDLGDVFVRVTYKGVSGEPLLIGIGHIGP